MSKNAKFYILLNHPLLPKQEEEIISRQMKKIVLPENLRVLWKQIDVPVSEHIAPIITYLKEYVTPDDIVFVQGHTGATYLVVEEVKALGAKAVYGHSSRDASEDNQLSKDSSEKSSKYRHLTFWEYGV